ncbi:MAG TPA: CAP domain-containing protein [Pyrinomonadaceae bacterium]|nr:CAP domain-containing protein [Pyrinomonadaceae bacterium]
MDGSRRGFLQGACAGLGVTLLDRTAFPDDLEHTFKDIRKNILNMINEERDVEKVQPVELDDLATEVATKHAVDMATNEFISHWGTDGLKPYHRYGLAGGTHANEENVSAIDGTWSMKAKDLIQDTAYLHVRLYQEKPPYDGHRRTILRPQHTHVGIGLAVEKLRLRMVELFVGKYVEVQPITREAKPGAKLSFSGKLMRKDYSLHLVEVYYEPLPTRPDLNWLRSSGSYALPVDSQVLRPVVPPPQVYRDGIAGVVEISKDGSFKTPLKLYKKEPGIYTIVAWIKRSKTDRPFPATAVYVKAQ